MSGVGTDLAVPNEQETLSLESLGGLKVYQAGDIERPEMALVYGPPASAKTPIIASANRVAGFAPVLFIDCDDGPKSLRRRFPEVRVVSPRTLGQLQRVCDSLLSKRGAGMKTIVLDGGSTVQFRGYEHLYGKEGRYRSFTEFESPTWGNHGYEASVRQMSILIENLKVLHGMGIHIFMTAWAKNSAKVSKGNAEPPPYWEPAFTPAVSDAINGRFDSILYLKTVVKGKDSVKVLQSRGTATVMARDRDDRLPSVIEAPSMELLAKHWGLDTTPVNGGTPEYNGG